MTYEFIYLFIHNLVHANGTASAASCVRRVKVAAAGIYLFIFYYKIPPATRSCLAGCRVRKKSINLFIYLFFSGEIQEIL